VGKPLFAYTESSTVKNEGKQRTENIEDGEALFVFATSHQGFSESNNFAEGLKFRQ